MISKGAFILLSRLTITLTKTTIILCRETSIKRSIFKLQSLIVCTSIKWLLQLPCTYMINFKFLKLKPSNLMSSKKIQICCFKDLLKFEQNRVIANFSRTKIYKHVKKTIPQKSCGIGVLSCSVSQMSNPQMSFNKFV